MRATYGRLITDDDGLALPFADGHSFTGEESIELSLHGSPESVRALITACCYAGARHAEPGEFSMRAFINNRIDLTQAEGIRDAVEADTDAQLRAAFALRDGKLTSAVGTIAASLLSVVARIEASIDFSDEVGELDIDIALAELNSALEKIETLCQTVKFSRIISEGFRIAIIGLPNAGKSTLLNRLVGADRAIVTDIPGTTRDTIEVSTSIGGYPCVLIDTAGLRETQDEVEHIGVQRAQDAASSADEVWYIFDSSKGWTTEDESTCRTLNAKVITLLATKCDLCRSDHDAISVSALTGEGIDELGYLIGDRFMSTPGYSTAIVNARHLPLLESAAEATRDAIRTIETNQPSDLAVVHLGDALFALGQITGDTSTSDMVDELFSSFCIGK